MWIWPTSRDEHESLDEIAVEEAVRLKEAGASPPRSSPFPAGLPPARKPLRTAMAIGADRGISSKPTSNWNRLPPLLKAPLPTGAAKLVICGKQAIDDDASQTGQMLAALAGWPQSHLASSSPRETTVTREIDGGQKPRDLAASRGYSDLRLNEPRYATLPKSVEGRRSGDTVKPTEPVSIKLPRLAVLKVMNCQAFGRYQGCRRR